MIDSHAHISTPKFAADRDAVLSRARDAGLTAIIDVGCDLPSSRDSVALAEADPLVWAVVGVHPHEAKHWDDQTAPALRELSKHPRVVAIGEGGLDFYYDHSPREVQRDVFRKQVALAIELDLPIVLHVRDAYDEAHALLDELSDPRLRGVSHCFTGDARQAAGFVERGFAVSFTGVVTFKSATQVQEAAKVVPPELLLVETDCPYMAPVPLRGKRNEPSFVVHTAEFLAQLRGEDPAELKARTAANTRRVFALPEA